MIPGYGASRRTCRGDPIPVLRNCARKSTPSGPAGVRPEYVLVDLASGKPFGDWFRDCGTLRARIGGRLALWSRLCACTQCISGSALAESLWPTRGRLVGDRADRTSDWRRVRELWALARRVCYGHGDRVPAWCRRVLSARFFGRWCGLPLTELPPGEVVERAQSVGHTPMCQDASGVCFQNLLKAFDPFLMVEAEAPV
jgi:hypothetical protein